MNTVKKFISLILVVASLMSFAIPSYAYSGSSFDARDFGWVTPVKSQGTNGTCWAFATVSALESDYIAKGYGTAENTDFSEAYFAWFGQNTAVKDPDAPTYGDGWNISDAYSTGGCWLQAMSVLESGSGIAFEKDFPYSMTNPKEMGPYPESDRYSAAPVLVEHTVKFGADEIPEAKKWIREHGSVTVSYYCDDKYLSQTDNECSYYSGTNRLYSHEVAVIGWDDNYPAKNFGKNRPPVNGAWLCKNSWGETWGDNGYFWLSYAEKTISVFEGYSVMKAEQCSNKYTYNGTTCSTGFSTTADIALANAFTAKADEDITAVTVTTFDSNTKVDVYVYTNVPEDFASPESGSLSATVSSFFPVSGYFTIPLPEKAAVSKDSIFTVVVEYESDNEMPCYPMEDGVDHSSRESESFVRCNGKWYDPEFLGDYNNAYIGAISAGEHNFVATETKSANCTENGYVISECLNCRRKQTVESEALGHRWCDCEGDPETKHCSICNDIQVKNGGENSGGAGEVESVPSEQEPEKSFWQIIRTVFDFLISFLDLTNIIQSIIFIG